jgi:hypothetical protein
LGGLEDWVIGGSLLLRGNGPLMAGASRPAVERVMRAGVRGHEGKGPAVQRTHRGVTYVPGQYPESPVPSTK